MFQVLFWMNLCCTNNNVIVYASSYMLLWILSTSTTKKECLYRHSYYKWVLSCVVESWSYQHIYKRRVKFKYRIDKKEGKFHAANVRIYGGRKGEGRRWTFINVDRQLKPPVCTSSKLVTTKLLYSLFHQQNLAASK